MRGLFGDDPLLSGHCYLFEEGKKEESRIVSAGTNPNPIPEYPFRISEVNRFL